MQIQKVNRQQRQKPKFMVPIWGGIAILLTLWLGFITGSMTLALPMGVAGSFLTAIVTEKMFGMRAHHWAAQVKRRRRF